jgi:hypothetical protein
VTRARASTALRDAPARSAPPRAPRGHVGAASIVLAALVVASGSAPASAQSATIAMTANRTELSVGETFQLQVRLDVTDAQAPDPELPDLSPFDVIGRQVSRPMQFSFGFGSQTQVVRSTVLYTFSLRALAPGTYPLAAPRANIAGRPFVGNPLTIVVRGGGGGASNVPGTPGGANVPSSRPPPGPLTGAIYDDVAFLQTVTEPSDPYVGEQVTVTIYLYMRGPLRGAPTITDEPTTDGFWVHDLLPPQRTLEGTQQMVGSMPFHAYMLRRFAAFPLRAGEVTIGPMSVQIPMGTVFDIFSTPQPDQSRTGVPVTLDVRALPTAGRPAGDVHVGALALEAALDRTQAPTGDAVTLTLRASGSGQVEALRVEAPVIDGLRILAPQTSAQVSAPSGVVQGVRTFEWLMVPEREGTFEIPAFRVPTFDPRAGTYGAAESSPLTLTAAGNPVAPSDVAPDEEDPSEEAADEAAFGPVRTESALARRIDPITRRAWYPWALAAIPLAWLALVIGRALRARSGARGLDPGKRASGEARRRLASAEAAAKAGDPRAHYAAVSLALKSVLEGRLGESVGSLTHPQMRKHLRERGMSEDLIAALVDELEAIELARFSAAGAEQAEMERQLARARELIGKLDRFVPKDRER